MVQFPRDYRHQGPSAPGSSAHRHQGTGPPARVHGHQGTGQPGTRVTRVQVTQGHQGLCAPGHQGHVYSMKECHHGNSTEMSSCRVYVVLPWWVYVEHDHEDIDESMLVTSWRVYWNFIMKNPCQCHHNEFVRMSLWRILANATIKSPFECYHKESVQITSRRVHGNVNMKSPCKRPHEGPMQWNHEESMYCKCHHKCSI